MCSLDGDCCGTLKYYPECWKCNVLAQLVKALDWRDSITLEPMTQREFEKYYAPVFIGDEGATVVGVWPVAQRIFHEVNPLRDDEKVLHGPSMVGRGAEKNILVGEHCPVCHCPQGHCCDWCNADASLTAGV